MSGERLGDTAQVWPEAYSSASCLREAWAHTGLAAIAFPSEAWEGRLGKGGPFHRGTVSSFWAGAGCEVLYTHTLLQVGSLCFEVRLRREESGKQLGLHLPGQPPVILLIVRY